jgi:hypothetical protein
MRVSTAAFCTLTAFAVGDLTQKAIAAPPPDSPTEDLAVLPQDLVADVMNATVTAIAPTESITVESFSHSNVPEDVSEFVSPEVMPEVAPEAIAVEPIVSEPELSVTSQTTASAAELPPIVEPGFVPVADLVTPNTAPEGAAVPERSLAQPLETRIAFRMPAAVEMSAPEPAELIAQGIPVDPNSPEPTDQEIEELQQQLDNVPNVQPEFGDEFGGAPAITISNPSGRGVDNFTAFLSTSFQADKRYEDGADGSLGVGIGLGDARRAVGLQLSYTLASFGTIDRDFGTGGFNAKLHRRFDNGLSIALGWEGFATIGDVDFEDTIYGSVTQIIRTTPDIDRPLSRIALTAGVGNGRFRSEEDVNTDEDTFNVFGSAAVRIARPVSVIVEWTGQDLAAGLSIAPFRNFPLVITPALRDITGAGDGARFVIGTGVSFRF